MSTVIPFSNNIPTSIAKKVLYCVNRTSIEQYKHVHESHNVKETITNVNNIHICNTEYDEFETNKISNKFSQNHRITIHVKRKQDDNYDSIMQQLKNNKNTTIKNSLFKDLDGVLNQIHCTKTGMKTFWTNTKKNITQQVIQSINNATITQSKYKISEHITEETKENYSAYWEKLEFVSNIAVDSNEWMEQKEEYDNIFKNDISKSLQIRASAVVVHRIKKGIFSKIINGFGTLVEFCVDWCVSKFLLKWSTRNISHIAIDRRYDMDYNDQIQVLYKDKWYPATVCEILNKPSEYGRQFKVRYNP
eukprot:301290_1